jgi:ankyrin repeat protein
MQDAESRSPLHYAAAHNTVQIARKLLEAGADPELVDTKGNTVLHYAAGYGRIDIVGILLETRAKTQVKNANGKTPSDLAGLNPKNPLLTDVDLMRRLGE